MNKIRIYKKEKFVWVAVIKGTREEVGIIEAKQINDYLLLEKFAVMENMRGRGIGKSLYSNLKLEVTSNKHIKEIVVYPHSSPFCENESVIEMKDLYDIYMSLGFSFVEKKGGDSCNQKMIYNINSDI